ncbi:siderophore-interacting protein [Paenibacillus sedimenti]|uniref:Siderophore-interacting protein n=1 Tax=Paenibacillus sedimenti TaxID=2770274 RepID=A0A926QM73_9BACL|nr:siderophore-interacting protein [Paenibacillus sedimenti]MBD0384385.1 siderophore-interacting protein [Paenibacillus sedimenti]
MNSGQKGNQNSSIHRSPRNLLHYAFAKHISEGTVSEVAKVSSSMLRIRIESKSLDKLSYTPGQYVRIQINDPLALRGLLRPGETLRSYTIWELTPEEQSFELRIYLHGGEGIGQSWARNVKAGDPVTFWGPIGDFVIRPASYHLFVGEETASVAFGSMIRSLGTNERIYGVLESNSPDEVPIPRSEELIHVNRNGASAVASKPIVYALSKLNLPVLPGTAYVAGESETCQMVLHHLVRDRGWPRSSIQVKPFWAPGKRGLH